MKKEREPGRGRGAAGPFFAAFFITLALFGLAGAVLLADRNVTGLLFGDGSQEAALFSFSRAGEAATVRVGETTWLVEAPALDAALDRGEALLAALEAELPETLRTARDAAVCLWRASEPLRERLLREAQSFLLERLPAA